MSSSRSDYVTNSVCVCVCGESFCLVGAFKAFEARCFQGVIRVLLGCSEESLMVSKRVFLVFLLVSLKFLLVLKSFNGV